MSIGTRGDVEPFLAIGEILHRKGHEVLFAFPEQYAHLVSEEFKFFPLSPKFLELLESREGKILMGGKSGIISKIKALRKLYKDGMAVNKILVGEQYKIIEKENPDKIIHNGKCNYPFLWHLRNGKEIILISPVPYFVHYAEGNAHLGFGGNLGKTLNRLTYRLANFGLVKTIKDAQKSVPQKIRFSAKEIRDVLFSVKLIYTISPTLFQKPDYWQSNVQILGYHERNKITDWQPDEKLIRFLRENEKVFFLTFGSMINPNPAATSKLIFSVLDDLKIPVIVNTAAGGLVELDEYEDNKSFHFVSQIPYDWILEKVFAIIHHGGSGTTHSGLKYGCASLIIPHIIDQFVWNNLVSKIGAGPKGISISKLSYKKLKPIISDLANNNLYKVKAREIAENMNRESLKSNLYEFLIDPDFI